MFSGNEWKCSSTMLCSCSVVSARGIKALCSHCHCMLTVLLMPPPPFSSPCGPEDKIQLWCTVAGSFSLDYSVSLTGSAALSLFSTSKEREKRVKQKEERHKRRGGGGADKHIVRKGEKRGKRQRDGSKNMKGDSWIAVSRMQSEMKSWTLSKGRHPINTGQIH